MPDPEAAFAKAANALRANPVTITDEVGAQYQITYAVFVQQVLYALYQPDGAEDVPAIVEFVLQLTTPQTSASVRVGAPPAMAVCWSGSRSGSSGTS